jgi:hypothetical protein
MDETFERGMVVYTLDGREVEYIAHIDGTGHVVRGVFDGDSEEPNYGEPFVAHTLFISPPTGRQDKRILELQEEIRALTEQREAIRASQIDERERKRRLMEHRAVARIDDFLAGKITHFVYYRYGVKIIGFDEAARYKESDYDKVPKGVKLLTLFGKTNGDLEWQLHRYSDGSGNPEEVIPCTSLEEAQAIAREKIEAAYAEWRGLTDKSRTYSIQSASDAARKLGFDVPEDIAAAVRATVLESFKKRRAELAAQLAEVEQKEAESGR